MNGCGSDLPAAASPLEEGIASWRAAITRSPAVTGADADELESHLREQAADLTAVGLSESEAFQIAVQRLGRVDRLTAEFAHEHGERMWKQLNMSGPPDAPGSPGASDRPAGPRSDPDPDPDPGTPPRRPLIEMIVFALIAAVAIQVARLTAGFPNQTAPWFPLNLSLFVLPVLAAYFARTRRLSPRAWVTGAAALAVIAVVVNLYPFVTGGQTLPLAAIHLPVLLWFLVGMAYLGGSWRRGRRMEFVRFTGEWAVYWVLLALGGGVLVGLTVLVLAPVAPGAINDLTLWIIPSGGAAAAIVAAWLVEAKRSVIENLAPVLTAIFTPLFAVMLLAASVVYLIFGGGPLFTDGGFVGFDRELLIVFDVLLLVVVGLVLYALSARDPAQPAGVLDAIRLVAIIAALVLDVLVLAGMSIRIAEFGFTPNRAAAVGLNLILVVNLAVTAWLSGRMLARRGTGLALERWQTGYLTVFAAWAAAVVLLLPPLFAFN